MNKDGSLRSKGKHLEDCMSVFKDIRLSSVIIADSIRTRELHSLRATGLLREPGSSDGHSRNITDPSRCPICLHVFYEPTVASKVCGHGMHLECANKFLPEEDLSATKLCCICRTPLTRDDLLCLQGILPNMENAAAWRSIVLTQPWEISDASESAFSTKTVVGCAERLMLSIRALFNQQNEFNRAMGSVMEFYNEIITANESEKDRLRRMREHLNRWQHKIEEDEMRLSKNRSRGEAFLLTYAHDMRREEGKLLKTMDSMVRKQLSLERLNEEIKSNEEDLHTRMREFEEHRRSEKRALRQMRETMDFNRMDGSGSPLQPLREENSATPNQPDQKGTRFDRACSGGSGSTAFS